MALSREEATISVGSEPIGDVSPYLFGALTEHFGNGIYGGLWDQRIDAPGADVKAAVGALAPTMLRYPGGCFADGYHWRDGVGAKSDRPTHDRQYWTDFDFASVMAPDVAAAFAVGEEQRRAFGPVETNAVGTNEFLQYCVDVDAEPMLVANFGTGDAAEAADWVRYTNQSRLAPRPVRWWGIGNETYGPWELGHCSPATYAERFATYARYMRTVDPEIKLVAVGSADRTGPYAKTWNAEVLGGVADEVDALSLHWYFPGFWVGRPLRDDESDYLQIAAGSAGLGEMLDAACAEIDAITGPERRLPISLDEWNLWVRLDELLEANARLCDAVFFAGCFNRMLERADRVRVAMISHLVNCLAPIQVRGDKIFVTSSYLVALLYRRYARGTSLAVRVACEDFVVPPFTNTLVSRQGVAGALTDFSSAEGRRAPTIDAAATSEGSTTTVFVTNRRLDDVVSVTIDGLAPRCDVRFRFLSGPGPFAVNDAEHPDRLHFVDAWTVTDGAGCCRLMLPPATTGAVTVEAQ